VRAVLLPDIGLIDRGRLQRLVTGRIRVSDRPDRYLIGAGAGMLVTDRPDRYPIGAAAGMLVTDRPDRYPIGAGAGDRPNPCQRSA
jgi:hypothetical protein